MTKLDICEYRIVHRRHGEEHGSDMTSQQRGICDQQSERCCMLLKGILSVRQQENMRQILVLTTYPITMSQHILTHQDNVPIPRHNDDSPFQHIQEWR